MNIAVSVIPQTNDPKQQRRLKSFFVGVAVNIMGVAFALMCWSMGFLPLQSVSIFATLAFAFNVGIFVMLRSGLSQRFADPSLTFLQITVHAMLGLYVMYFAGELRAAFLLLGLAVFSFGMFRLNTRGFALLGVLIMSVYAILIALLIQFEPHTTNLKLELLLWVAFAMTLGQFSVLAGMIDALRRNVRKKNQELAHRYAELETALHRISDMAIRDELTGVHNRRYLMERIAEESHRCTRNGSTFCIGMIDIDLFKRINDTHGHLSGDDVLRSVASTASKTLRDIDFFGRFGGEEFVMVLTDTPIEDALITAERIRERIEQLVFPSIDQTLRVTISIGVAEHDRKTDPALTLRRADEALYRAKESGRNKCMTALLKPCVDAFRKDKQKSPDKSGLYKKNFTQ